MNEEYHLYQKKWNKNIRISKRLEDFKSGVIMSKYKHVIIYSYDQLICETKLITNMSPDDDDYTKIL